MSRIDTVETEVFNFDELSEEGKEKALADLYDTNTDQDWWENTYEDAARVGIKITGFDLDRGAYCEGDIYDHEATAEAITENHGTKCETYLTAVQYQADRSKLVIKYSDGYNIDIVAEDNEFGFDDDCNELDEEFKKSLLEDYRIILQHEYEYLTSEEAIIETILANAYEFTANGKLY